MLATVDFSVCCENILSWLVSLTIWVKAENSCCKKETLWPQKRPFFRKPNVNQNLGALKSDSHIQL